MRHTHAISARAQVIARSLGNRDAAMLAASATDRNGKLLLAFLHITRHHAIKQALPMRHELNRLVAIHHKIANRSIETRKRLKRGVVIRVRKETHVDDDIGIKRSAMLEAKGVHGNSEAFPLIPVAKQLADFRAQLHRKHIGSIHHVLSHNAKLIEQCALGSDTLRDCHTFVAQRMTATTCLITSDELVVIGVEEHNAKRNTLAF